MHKYEYLHFLHFIIYKINQDISKGKHILWNFQCLLPLFNVEE